MQITAKMVKELREATNAGMMDCKRALTEANGDIERAKEILREQPDARVVMCSALGQEALVIESIAAGAKDFIVKPFKPESVVTTLRKALEKES